jgi:ATP-binding cassette subfamily B protein
MSFFTAIGLAFEPLRRLGTLSATLQIAAAGIERVKGLLEFKPSLLSPQNPISAPTGAPAIELTNVGLTYGGTEVLRNVSFIAEAGKTTALVGASGAGKSTIFNLLTRLVDPQTGQVAISGVSIDSLRLEDLRQLYSVVAQDALLFDESLRENILLGQTDIDPDVLQSVLDAAHISDFLPRLSNGLESPVGPRGSLLSGGQRQRVAIARALLRDTPILLLDEATSALDAQSEQTVQAALDKLSQGRTTLVIAHRLATIRNADKIIVMADGQVIETGTHKALLARGGAYTDLYNLQLNEAKSA